MFSKSLKDNLAFILLISFTFLSLSYLLFTFIFAYKVLGLDHFNLSKVIKGFGSMKNIWTFIIIGFGLPKYFSSLLMALIISLLSHTSLFMLLIFGKDSKSLYGKAKFESAIRAIKRYKADKGVVLAKLGSNFLIEKSDKFVMLISPPRTGKGVQVGVPTHFEFRDSIVSLDIKGESFQLTSKYRQEVLKQEIIYFNPSDPNTRKYNPLGYIKQRVDTEATQLGRIAAFFYQSDGGKDSMWNEQAKSLFIGTGLLLSDLLKARVLNPATMGYNLSSLKKLANGIYSSDINSELFEHEELIKSFSFLKKEDSEGQIIKMEQLIKVTAQAVKVLGVEYEEDSKIEVDENEYYNNRRKDEYYQEFINDKFHYFKCNYSVIRDVSRNFLSGYFNASAAEATQAGFMAQFNGGLTLFSDLLVCNATETNDFDIRDIRRKLMSIYLCIKPQDIANYKTLISLFFDQLIKLNLDVQPLEDDSLKYQVLLLMDEFPALGKIPAIAETIGYMPSYGFKLLIICQTSAQLIATYGKDVAKNMMDSINTKIYFPPNNFESAESISKELGEITFKQSNISTSSKMNSGVNTSRSEQRRRLMLPQELMRMGNKCLILADKELPIVADRFAYYKESRYIDKVKKLINRPDLKDLNFNFLNDLIRNKVLEANLNFEKSSDINNKL